MSFRLLTELRLRPQHFLDKALFLIFAAGGVAGLFGAKSAGLSQIAVTSGLVGAIVFYLLGGVALGRVKLRPDQVGDNCYYLGFIYTLGSLGYTLYVFTGDAAGVSTIVSNFGIALLTTMVGIVLRVVLHQWRQDPADIEQEARIALAEAALRLRAELDEVVLQMSSFRAATQQSIAEAFDEIAMKAGAVLTDAAASFDAVSTKATERIDAAFSTFSADAERLGKNSGEVVGALETLIGRIGKIEAPADLVERKITPAIGKIGDLVNLLEARARRDEKRAAAIDAMIERMAGAAAETERAVSTIGERAEDVRSALSGLTDFREESDRFAESVARTADAARLLAEEGRRLVEDIKPLIASTMRSIAEEERKAVESVAPLVASSLKSITGAARSAIKELSGSVTQETRQVADELRSIGETSRAETRRVVESLLEELRASSASAAKHREEIAAHSERVREAQQAIIQGMGRLDWVVKRSDEQAQDPEVPPLAPSSNKNANDPQPASASGGLSWLRGFRS